MDERCADIKLALKNLKKGVSIDDSFVSEQLNSLRVIFTYFLENAVFSRYGVKRQTENESKSEVTIWLEEKFDLFLKLLMVSVTNNKRFALVIFFKLLKVEVENSEAKAFSNVPLITMLVRNLTSNDKLETFFSGVVAVDYVNVYHDVKYYVICSIKEVVQNMKSREGGEDERSFEIDNLLTLLTSIHYPESEADIAKFLVPIGEGEGGNFDYENENENDDDDENDDFDAESGDGKKRKKSKNNSDSRRKKKKHIPSVQRLSAYRSKFGETWLAFLKLPLSPRQHNKVLSFLPQSIIPHLNEPLVLAHYLTLSYSVGGATALNALNSLFILMTQHNLEYPKFYQSLYALVDCKMFYSKHRTRFFKLLNICLSSTHLPAYVVASFMKRMCRASLNAPASGCLFTIAFVHNLLLRHSECGVLVDRNGVAELNDQFDPEESDPSKSGALNSSLWELKALKKHFHADVSKLAFVFDKIDNKTLPNDLDEHLAHSYKSLFASAIQARGGSVKLAFAKPDVLFLDGDLGGGMRMK